jgi:S1-C subfamily serine protease
VIGINTAMALGAENIGFTIPINQVKKSIIQVETSGVIKTSYLGVRYVLINSDLQKKNNLPVDYGAWVYSNTSEPAIVPGSPAQKAGLKQGDIILELNQEKITVNSPLTVLLKKYEPGETITLKILRDEKETEIKITLGER